MYELSTMVAKEKGEWKTLNDNGKLERFQRALEQKQKRA